MKQKFFSLLLLGVLLTFVIPVTQVYAGFNYSLSYAPNRLQFFETIYEVEATNDTVQLIAQLFSSCGNNYASSYYIDASESQYLTVLYVAEHSAYVDNISFFTKGHTYGETCGGGTAHRAHMAYDEDEYVFDSELSDCTCGKTKLAVIWHCGTAQEYEQYESMYCSYCGKYYSFPMVYTKYNGMSMDGYGDPSGTSYVFLGFIGYSEQFLSDNGLDLYWYYYHFVSYFYQRLVQYSDDVNDALDAACYASSGYYWPDHWISQFKRDWDPDGDGGALVPCNTTMKIYGNGEAHYPGY